jgi:hypothetical protein
MKMRRAWGDHYFRASPANILTVAASLVQCRTWGVG